MKVIVCIKENHNHQTKVISRKNAVVNHCENCKNHERKNHKKLRNPVKLLSGAVYTVFVLYTIIMIISTILCGVMMFINIETETVSTFVTAALRAALGGLGAYIAYHANELIQSSKNKDHTIELVSLMIAFMGLML